jgi:GT2 family glycosyltransferase
VGGPVRPVAQTVIAKSNVLARSSIFGVGRGIYSIGKEPRFVDTVQCGVYKRDIFDEVGFFDESLQFGEDEEINWRIRKKGYKIYLTPKIRFFCFVRDSFGKLFKQYYNYGMARVKVIKKHPDFLNIKHVIPTTFILASFATGILSMFSNWFSGLFWGIALAYLIVSLGFSAQIGAKEGYRYIALVPISFAALHLGYGMGFLMGISGVRFFGGKETLTTKIYRTFGKK